VKNVNDCVEINFEGGRQEAFGRRSTFRLLYYWLCANNNKIDAFQDTIIVAANFDHTLPPIYQ
jgi:hypothetical protein